MISVNIRPVAEADALAWERLRQRLWPAPAGEHAREIADFFRGPRTNPAEVFLAADGSGAIVGFAEASIRREAAGCRLGRVAFLEGWFVDQSFRRAGVGAALVAAVERWGRQEGCSELASDTEIHNELGIAAHRAVGFEEVERVVCFRKPLTCERTT